MVVLKQLRPELAEEPNVLTLFMEEARLALRLQHPNVVETLEVGVWDQRYFLSTEYLEGQSFDQLMQRFGTGDPAIVPKYLRILLDVLVGLHYAHTLQDDNGAPLGVVHSNVTPHSVFIDYRGHVKVTNFGSAHVLRPPLDTGSALLRGRFAYLAPERARGERADLRADLFSVGVMLWQAVTGQPLWKGLSDVMVLTRLSAGHIPSVLSVRPMTSPRLAAVCDRALAHHMEDRYRTADEMSHDLLHCLEDLGDHVELAEVGSLLAQLFSAEKSERQATLEAQLRLSFEGGRSEGRPSFAYPGGGLEDTLPEHGERFSASTLFDRESERVSQVIYDMSQRWLTVPVKFLWVGLILALGASCIVTVMLWQALHGAPPSSHPPAPKPENSLPNRSH